MGFVGAIDFVEKSPACVRPLSKRCELPAERRSDMLPLRYQHFAEMAKSSLPYPRWSRLAHLSKAWSDRSRPIYFPLSPRSIRRTSIEFRGSFHLALASHPSSSPQAI